MGKKKVAPGQAGEAVPTPASSVEEKQSEGLAQQPSPTPTPEPMPAPVPVAKPVEQAHVPVGSKAAIMKAKLAAEPKVRVMIPLASGEKAGVTQSVILNGYHIYIRKGEYVEVPQSVAEVLEAKMKQKLAVDNHPLRADAEGGVKMDRFGS
jgi:hypothetical protein